MGLEPLQDVYPSPLDLLKTDRARLGRTPERPVCEPVESLGRITNFDPQFVTKKEELRSALQEHSVKTGRFQLAHGGVSEIYIDAKLTVLRSDAAGLVGQIMLEAINRCGFNATAVGGLEAGAIPLATAVVTQAGAVNRKLAGFFVRKEKKEHGREQRVEGIEDPKDQPAVILDDTVTTGKSTWRAVEAAQRAGFVVLGAIALVDRDMGAREYLFEKDVPYRWVFDLDELNTGGNSS